MFFNACQKDDVKPVEDSITEITLNEDQVELKNKMNEAAQILAKFSNDKSVQEEIAKMVDLKMYSDDYIKFKDLFQPESNSKLKSTAVTKFAQKFRATVVSNKLKSTGDDEFDLENYLVENNLVLYIPYPLEDYPENNRTPTVTFHPLTNDSVNIGYLFSNLKSINQILLVNDVNEEYSEGKAVFVISPDDIFADGGGGSGSGGSGGSGTGGTGITKFWLKKNVGRDYVTQADVMTTVIPRMKLTGDYRGLFGGGSLVHIYKYYPKKGVGSDLTFDHDIIFKEWKFSRREARNGTWKDVNITFDNDWDVTESNVLFVLITRQHAFSGTRDDEIKVSTTLNYGWDSTKDEPSTKTNTTVKVEHNFGKGERLKLRYQAKMSRAGTLANVVGDWLLNGTYDDGGVKYTIRLADKLRYYFKHSITKNN